MSALNSVNQTILDSQLANVQVRQAIDIKVAKKALESTEAQADAALQLLDAAVEMARQAGESDNSIPTFGALVSGLGQYLDISA